MNAGEGGSESTRAGWENRKRVAEVQQLLTAVLNPKC